MPTNYIKKQKGELNFTWNGNAFTSIQNDDRAKVPLPQLIEKARLEQREVRKSEGRQWKSNLIKPGQSSTKTETSSTCTPSSISRKDAPPVKVRIH